MSPVPDVKRITSRLPADSEPVPGGAAAARSAAPVWRPRPPMSRAAVARIVQVAGLLDAVTASTRPASWTMRATAARESGGRGRQTGATEGITEGPP